MLVVSVERTGTGSGTERSITVRYDGGSLDLPLGIALCVAKCSDSEVAAMGL